LEASPDGSVFASVAARPADVVQYSPTGGQSRTLARFSQVPDLDMIVAMPDGRAVLPVSVNGRVRLMGVRPGVEPSPVVTTNEETSSPLTAVGGNRIAFAIGREPPSIAVAETATGRIGARITPGKGFITSLGASPDGATLYIAAGGVIWSVASTGGELRKVCPGDAVAADPGGRRLVVSRNANSGIALFEVPLDGGTERPLPMDSAIRLLPGYISPGTIREGRMLISLMIRDSWFNPLALLDLASGHITPVAGDGVSDFHSGAWTRDGQIVVCRLGLVSSIWRFTPER